MPRLKYTISRLTPDSSRCPEHPTIGIVRRFSRPVSRATRAVRGPESARARRESPASK